MNEDDIRDMQADAQMLVDQFDDLLRSMAQAKPVAQYSDELGWHVMVNDGQIFYTEEGGALVCGSYQRELQTVLQEAKDREANPQGYGTIEQQSKLLVDKLTTPRGQASPTPAEHSVEGTTLDVSDEVFALGRLIGQAIVTFIREGT